MSENSCSAAAAAAAAQMTVPRQERRRRHSMFDCGTSETLATTLQPEIASSWGIMLRPAAVRGDFEAMSEKFLKQIAAGKVLSSARRNCVAPNSKSTQCCTNPKSFVIIRLHSCGAAFLGNPLNSEFFYQSWSFLYISLLSGLDLLPHESGR